MRKVGFFLLSVLLSIPLLTACAAKAPDAAVVEIALPSPAPTAVLPSPDPLPVRTPAPRPAPTFDPLSPGDSIYTFAWISDTQHYSEYGSEAFRVMTEYLAARWEELRLAYVVHTGDFVQNSTSSAEWELAADAMLPLSGRPCGILAGNHDVAHSGADYRHFTENFSRFIEESPCVSDIFQSGRCHADLISAGSTRYVFVFVGYPATEETADWASRIFQKYPDRVGVLLAHDYLKTDRTRSEGGDLLFSRVVKPNDNVYLVLCGHRYSVGVETVTVGERTVYQLIANYQASGSYGGYGYIRFLQVNESEGTLTAFSYSPLLNDFGYYDLPWSQREKYPVDPADESMELPLPWG